MKRYILPILATLTALTGVANVTADRNCSAEFMLTEEDRAALSFENMLPAVAATDDKITTLDFHYCNNPMTSLRLGQGEYVENSAAIKLPKEWLQNYVGAKITAVTICAGFNSQTFKNHVTDVTIFLNRDIFTQEPFYKQSGRLERVSRKWNEIPMKTPYVIDGSSDLYVGFTVVRPTLNDATFVVDRSPNFTGCSFWANYQLDGKSIWEDMSGEYGSLCMRLTIESDNLPQNDVTLTGLDLPNVVGHGVKFTGSFIVTNHGVNPVNTVTIQASVGEDAPQSTEIKLPKEVTYNESFSVSIDDLVCNDEGLSVPVVITATSVNGVEDTYPSDNTLNGSVRCIEDGFMRNVVFEEGTGTWCGYCPRGAYAMDYMLDKYRDGSFIGIAAHQGDMMQINTINLEGKTQVDFLHGYGEQFAMVSGYPHARYGRIAPYGTDIPSAEYVEDTYKKLRELPAIAKVDFDLYINDTSDTITVVGNTEFSINSKDEFRMVYVLLEDGLGPWGQTNYFAGTGRNKEVGAWADMSNPAIVTFNHVARYVTSYFGEKGTVPSPVRPGEKYGHKTVIPLTNLLSGNIDKASVVGMVVNYRTGEVENAILVHCKSELPPISGIGEVAAEADSAAATMWYTIHGIRVAEPTVPGVYVKVTGSRSEKVLVK